MKFSLDRIRTFEKANVDMEGKVPFFFHLDLRTILTCCKGNIDQLKRQKRALKGQFQFFSPCRPLTDTFKRNADAWKGLQSTMNIIIKH